MSAEYKKFARTDDLMSLIALAKKFLPDQMVKNFVRFQFIIDANLVLQDIRYLLTKTNTSDARTGFLELLEAGAIGCYAPSFLETEIAEKIPVLADKYSFSSQDGFALWGRFSKHIEFVDVGGPESAPGDARDPKDWPYVELHHQLQHPVVTNDKDIAGMGAVTAKFTVIASLRNYARESANAMSIIVYGGLAISIPSVVLSKSFSFLYGWIGEKFVATPKWVWGLIVLLVGVLLIYPPSRAWLHNKVSAMAESSKDAALSFLDAIEPVYKNFENSRQLAEKSLSQASESITVRET